MAEKKKAKNNGGFCKRYRHWRTGEIMEAADYGYKAWPFGGCAQKP